jgi:predicted RNA binding protein with dsRBD fold (UPF0201 family)
LIKTEIRVEVQPTEDTEKVKHAIQRVFGEIELTQKDNVYLSELSDLESLSHLRSIIAQDRVRDTFNKVLTRWTRDGTLSFGLNRQAAYMGHVSFYLTNEDPLGPINVVITGDIETVIEFLTKKTKWIGPQ